MKRNTQRGDPWRWRLEIQNRIDDMIEASQRIEKCSERLDYLSNSRLMYRHPLTPSVIYPVFDEEVINPFEFLGVISHQSHFSRSGQTSN